MYWIDYYGLFFKYDDHHEGCLYYKCSLGAEITPLGHQNDNRR